METRPSTPLVASKTGLSTSHALRTSVVVSAKTVWSTSAPLGGELAHLVVVALAVGQRRGEDRRVGGDADDVVVLDQVGEVAGLDPLAGEVVEPDGDPRLRQLLQVVGHFFLLLSSAGRWPRPSAVLAGGHPDAVLRGRGHGLGGDAELAVDPVVVGRRAVVLERDDPAVVADDLAPALGDAGLDRDPRLDRRRDARSPGRTRPGRRTIPGRASTRRGRGRPARRGSRGPGRPAAPPSRCRPARRRAARPRRRRST